MSKSMFSALALIVGLTMSAGVSFAGKKEAPAPASTAAGQEQMQTAAPAAGETAAPSEQKETKGKMKKEQAEKKGKKGSH